MSFNTFCGQDPANAATYNKVLLRFQEGGGGGGVATVNNGTNITIGGPPANPTVNLDAPLTSTLNMGAQSLTDSAGAVGLVGEVLTCGAAGGQTLWGAMPAAAPVITSTNANANYYPTFVTAGGGVARPLFCDDGATPFSVNPSNGNFNVVDTVIITQSQLAIGKTSGAVAQAAGGVAIGFAAAAANQGQDAISIGSNAGNATQGIGAVAIGAGAANNNQGIGGIAIGNAASTGAFQGASAIAIGVSSCGDPLTSQGNGAISIGSQAGFTSQGAASIAIGEDAGYGTQSDGAVAIGDAAGNFTQGQDAVAIGTSAGLTNQGNHSVAIGLTAGQTNQGVDSVAIGTAAGRTTQGISSIAIGENAGQTTQSDSAIAIGTNAGLTTQGGAAVAIGIGSGGNNQGNNAVAVGNGSGNVGQGAEAVGVGISAGQTNQGAGAVAIGAAAGQAGQGANAIAIGEQAGSINQTANSICINATGVAVQTTTAGLYIDPIVAGPAIANPVPAATQFLTYDTATKEITYRDGAGIGGGGGASYPLIVPLYRQLQPAPQTAVGITNGAPCELTAGTLTATIAEIYDPVAAAALGLSTVVQVEYWYSAGFANGSNQMIFPVFPQSERVNDINPGMGPLGLFYAPKYIPSTTGVRTAYLGSQGCYSSSMLLEMPSILAGERGFTAPVGNLQTQTSLIVALDVAGFAPTDTIQFVLDAYTQYPLQILDTSQPYPQVEYFGQISITTSMTRA